MYTKINKVKIYPYPSFVLYLCTSDDIIYPRPLRIECDTGHNLVKIHHCVCMYTKVFGLNLFQMNSILGRPHLTQIPNQPRFS